MNVAMNSILYIFLPCKKVYPIGVTYLADFIHRRKPDVRQRILDLSLFPSVATEPGDSRCRHRVQAGPCLFLLARHSDLFARTRAIPRWNMRSIFILRAIHFKRVVASFAGLKQLYRYYSHIHTILSYPWLIRKEFPKAQIMIGGGAFTAFADQLIEKLPEGTIGLLGKVKMPSSK